MITGAEAFAIFVLAPLAVAALIIALVTYRGR